MRCADPNQAVKRIFDVRVASEIPLPGLPAAGGADSDIEVRVADQGQRDWQAFKTIHEWKTASGATVLACARHANSYLLHFPGIGDFHLPPGGREILVAPSADAPDNELARVLTDQVLPRVLAHTGRAILHASAIVTNEGLCPVFLGNTGYGKSTLAASFYESTGRLLSDDCLQLDLIDEALHGLAAYPGLRLWPESIEGLSLDRTRSIECGNRGRKHRLSRLDAARTVTGPHPVDGLFVLGRPPEGRTIEEIVIERLDGAAATVAAIESAFVLDLDSREAVRRNFEGISRIVKSGVPLFRLSYPRRYEWLPRVRDRIVEALNL